MELLPFLYFDCVRLLYFGGVFFFCTCNQFQELSVQLGVTKRELAEVEAQLQATLRDKKRGVLTRGELDGVADGTRMYQSVGERCAS